MKRFSVFVLKEWRHIWRDKRSLFILFGMPLVQIMLFGYAVTNEIRQAPVAILDHSHDDASRQMQEHLFASGYFRAIENPKSEADIDGVLRSGKAKEVIVFEPYFEQNMRKNGHANIQIITDATDPNTASTLLNYSSAIMRQQFMSQAGPGPLPIDIISRMRYNPQLKGVFLFIPGLITIILMLVSAMMTSISITREKELGTMEILLVSPMRPAQLIIAKVTPYILLSLINAVTILLLGYYVFGVPILGSKLLLMAECVLFILSALSLGVMISTVSKTQQVALLISLMGLMLPTIILSGFIFPIENMPLPLRTISRLIPARWFIVIAKGIMLKGVGLEVLWKETLTLIGFTLFFMAVSIRRFKIRLE